MNEVKQNKSEFPFLNRGGEMGALIRSYDWSKSSLGPIETWPTTLTVSLNIMLNSKFPMFLFWGPELICFYNDAYRPSLGDPENQPGTGKHPGALGRRGEEVWPEIWDFIKPLIDQAMNEGQASWFEDQLLPIYRNGKLEDVYWTFSYSPVISEDGSPTGVLVTCTETTEKVQAFQKLDDSRNQLLFALEAAGLCDWDMDPETNLVSGNIRLKEWFGFPDNKNVPLKLAIARIVPEERHGVMEEIQRALAPGASGAFDVEYSIIHPVTNRIRRVRSQGLARFNTEGKPIRFNGILQDVTEEVKAREEQQKLITLIENSADYMGISDLNGNIQYLNKTGKEILGIDPETDLFQLKVKDFYTEEDFQYTREIVWPELLRDERWTGVLRLKHFKTHELIPFLAKFILIYDPLTGKPIARGATLHDLRQEVAARKQRRERELRLRNAMELAELGTFEVYPDMNTVRLSSRIKNWIGFTAERNPSLEDLFSNIKESEQLKSAITEAFKQGVNAILNVQFRAVDPESGREGIYHSLARVVENEKEGTLLLRGVIRDITIQKMNQEELEKLVKQRTKALLEANTSLERTNKELEEFAYVASHDLQEPLRKIRTFSEMILASPKATDPDLNKYLVKIGESAQRMSILIRDLLNFSQLARMNEAFSKVDLNQILQNVRDNFELLIQEKGAKINSDKLPVLEAIPLQINQLFNNLIGNSLKFADMNRPIEINISVRKLNAEELNNHPNLNQALQYFEIVFSDNGIGFSQEYAEQIFTIFQRLNNRSTYAGTGIGLALCRKIATNHQGKIYATSVEDQGSNFYLVIPERQH